MARAGGVGEGVGGSRKAETHGKGEKLSKNVNNYILCLLLGT